MSAGGSYPCRPGCACNRHRGHRVRLGAPEPFNERTRLRLLLSEYARKRVERTKRMESQLERELERGISA